jgi:hypothetical protein
VQLVAIPPQFGIRAFLEHKHLVLDQVKKVVEELSTIVMFVKIIDKLNSVSRGDDEEPQGPVITYISDRFVNLEAHFDFTRLQG